MNQSQSVVVHFDHEIGSCCQKKNNKRKNEGDNTLTATEATRELDVKGPVQPITEGQLLKINWDCAPGLETAVSVHVKAEEVAITHGSWVFGGR